MNKIGEFLWNKRVPIMLTLGWVNVINGVLTLLSGDLIVGLGILGLGVFLCYDTKNLK
jgi:hypothetical protein